VAVGNGDMNLEQARRVAFVFTEIFTFTADKDRPAGDLPHQSRRVGA
jgi:hypothetical protein